MLTRDFSFVLLRGFLLSGTALAITLPIVRKIHDHFGLGVPPFNGVFLMFFALLVAFLGSALVGAISGTVTPSHKSYFPLVAGGGLLWGFGVLLWFVPFYGGIVADDVVRSSAAFVVQHQNDLVPRANSAVEAFQKGQAGKATQVLGETTMNGAHEVGKRTVSQMPALLILSWTILIPPFLAMWEYRSARERTALSYF